MRVLKCVLVLILACALSAAQHPAVPGPSSPPTLVSGLGDLHHPVSASNAQAQQFFDQGLRQIYAFNHDEAARSFQRAADLAPRLAMAYWGVAEAIGPNYNDPASDDRFAAAHTAIQKAVDLSDFASPAEQAYIKAMAGANRLAAMAPAAGHIVHMPAHVYIRTGDYAAAVKTNQEAAAVDEAYIKASGAQGIYPLMYYSHNLHFIAMCAAMNGDYAEANKNADLLAGHVAPHVKDMPPLEGFMTIPIAVDVRFHKWDEVLKMPRPDPEMKIMTVFWHFARGVALAAKGKVTEAEAEYQVVSEAEKN